MTSSTPATILVVDDTIENITTLAGALRDQYRVLFATNGPDALNIVRRETIDLILLDVMMPDMDGYEVCRRLKANLLTQHIPVIFVTAMSDTTDEVRGLECGAVDYLRKPSAALITRKRVQLHLEHGQQNRALESLVRERTRELEETRIEIVRRLGLAAEYRDNETGMHVIRMSHTSRLLALAAGASEAMADLLLNAAPMHDVGKIGIPDRVLTKPGPLDAEEWALMQTHPAIGAKIIGEHASPLMQMARTVSLTHHEKWDGSGYPAGVAGEDIPLEGRIVSIADVYDALTSERPYKKAWSSADALAHIQAQAGKAFDPQLVAHFLPLVGEVEAIRQRYADTPDPRFDERR